MARGGRSGVRATTAVTLSRWSGVTVAWIGPHTHRAVVRARGACMGMASIFFSYSCSFVYRCELCDTTRVETRERTEDILGRFGRLHLRPKLRPKFGLSFVSFPGMLPPAPHAAPRMLPHAPRRPGHVARAPGHVAEEGGMLRARHAHVSHPRHTPRREQRPLHFLYAREARVTWRACTHRGIWTASGAQLGPASQPADQGPTGASSARPAPHAGYHVALPPQHARGLR